MKKTKAISESQIRKKHSYMKLPVFECDKGWNNLIEKLCNEISKIDKNKQVSVIQIKEKLGTLRFYVYGSTHQSANIIIKYEQESAKICEVCGKKGKLKMLPDFWYKTLCEKHAQKLGYVDIKINQES